MRVTYSRISFLVTLCTLVFGVVGCAGNLRRPSPLPTIEQQLPRRQLRVPRAPCPRMANPQRQLRGTATARGKIDACALLTSQEIRSVQGEPLKETKASGSAEKGFSISQCFFTLPTFNNSISLSVTQKATARMAAIRKSFGKRLSTGSRKAKKREERDKKSAKEREEENEEAAPPQKIAGVGDEAFWTGSRVGGALYVLKGSTYLRVSVGGAGDQQSKINKSKALARLALKRL